MTLRVVMIDDEPYSREMFSLSANLEALDMVLVASLESPLQLLEKLEDLKPDIVVTDIRMPEMDGLELIGRIQAAMPDGVAYILLSAYSQIEYAKQAIQLGVKYYVIKPYLPAEMNAVLKKAGDELRKAREQRQRESELSHYLLGRMVFRLLHHPTEQETEGLIKTGAGQYGIVGLFFTDAVSCIRDITVIHQYLSDCPECIIVQRQPTRIEFLLLVPGENGLERAVNHLRRGLETCDLNHDYYVAAGVLCRNNEELRESWKTARSISDQAVWRADRHWMQHFMTTQTPAAANRLPEVIRAMETGEQDEAEKLIGEQLEAYREQLCSPQALQLMADQLAYRSLSLNIISDSEAMFAVYQKRLQNMDHLYVDQVRERLNEYSRHFIGLLKEFQEQVRLHDDPVLMIRSYIEAHYAEPLTVQKIAEDLFFHPAYIGTLFKKNTGISIHQYLHQIRIMHAVEMMNQPDTKLTQIALDVGYNDYPSFITAFRQIQGNSPSGFLRESRNIDTQK